MKYSLLINQKAVFDLGLDKEIDIIDLAIFDFMLSFSSSPSCKRIIEDDKLYFWVKWDLITKNIPLLPVKTRGSVYTRIKKLVDCGLIEANPNNQIKSMSYYTLTKKSDRFLLGDITPNKEENDCLPKSTGTPLPVYENVQVCILKSTDPISEKVHNNTIIDNTISNNILYKENSNFEKQIPTKEPLPQPLPTQDPQPTSLLEESNKWFGWKTDVGKLNRLVDLHFDIFHLRRGQNLYSNVSQIKMNITSPEFEEDYPLQLEAYVKGLKEGLFFENYQLKGWLEKGWSTCIWTDKYVDLFSKKIVKEKELEAKTKKFAFNKQEATPISISTPKAPINGFVKSKPFKD